MRIALLLIVLLGALASGVADAGHEISFYPSFYPQEIKVEFVTPDAAAARLRKPSLHAYVGADPFRGGPLPAHVAAAESLGSYVVLTFNRGAGDAAVRCAAGARVLAALSTPRPGYTFHPYPVTPYHDDYLAHADLADAARRKAGTAGSGGAALRVRARGPWADALRAAGVRVVEAEGDATLEELDARDIGPARMTSLNGWRGPSWIKEGWFQAYRLYASAITDGETQRAVDDAFERRVHGRYASTTERVNVERRLVSSLTRGCERVSVGYTPRREVFSVEYSEGVENVAYDAQSGLGSAIFLRTVKLKDFPWNGWLRVGTERRPLAAWNPIAGFTDDSGRLIWAAVGDAALLPAPQNGSWLPNRVRPGAPQTTTDVPADALAPDPATGVLRPVPAGAKAEIKIVYRVLASRFHHGPKMGGADILHAYGFPYRWGRRGASTYDPEVDRATAALREALVAVRVVKVDTEVRDLGEVQVAYDIPEVEVYLGGGVPADAAVAMAPPWTAIPWELTALMETAVARGIAAFSETEAKRRGVPWLDLARDARVKDRLASLLAEFERTTYVPPALRGVVKVEQVRERWAALRRFYRTHGHLLVANGPYQLGTWTPEAVVLAVFRDLSYPLGVGSYDRYPFPRRAYVTRAERRGDRLELDADVERVAKFERSHTIVREPFRPQPAGETLREPTPVAHYAVVDGQGTVALTGVSEMLDGARVVIDLGGKLAPGEYRVLTALVLDENVVNADVKVIPFRVGP
ncbi:MAG TPA: hypothetical protein VGL09_02230 [Methylomirabilota bacterium]